MVICQHSHCIGCEEKYKSGIIVYGQGNFLFDHCDNEFWQTGLLIEVDMEISGDDNKDSDDFKISYIPIVKKGNTVRLADEEKGQNMVDAFKQRSEEIKQFGFISKRYSAFADQMEREYLYKFSGTFGRNIFIRILNKVTSYGFLKKFYPVENKVVIENILECEAHRELATEVMRSGRR